MGVMSGQCDCLTYTNSSHVGISLDVDSSAEIIAASRLGYHEARAEDVVLTARVILVILYQVVIPIQNLRVSRVWTESIRQSRSHIRRGEVNRRAVQAFP